MSAVPLALETKCYSNTQLAIFIKCPSLLHLMGVLLLLSQERWQKFVSFGFDHIISGFCYLIRQKFKLTSFSVACFRVSCAVWSGFWQFFNEKRERETLFGIRRGKERKPFTWAPGATSAFQKRSQSQIKVPTQGQVEGGLCQPLSPRGGEEEGWGPTSVIYFCVQGPLALHSWGQTC